MQTHQTTNAWSSSQKNGIEGFTFTELLVVVATLAILMLVLAPALASVKPNSKIEQCLDGKRQLTLAWEMYASDNSDRLMNVFPWVGGQIDWSASPQNTNTALLTNPTNALIGAYNSSPAVFKCPADFYQSAANPGPRVRSVSMSLILTGNPTIQGTAPGNRKYFSAKRLSDLARPGPAMVFVFLDEHADSINDGAFALDPGYQQGLEKWRDLPAAYHDGSCGMSFADGHTEMHAWQQKTGINKTTYPVLLQTYGIPSSSPWNSVNQGISKDYEWLEGHMPYH
jgi:prepilin-type processing-associated H-X9-DG protein